jgi:hypothetical protein
MHVDCSQAWFASAVRLFWGFENTLPDLYNRFNAIGINRPTFNSPGANGAGSCLRLTSVSQQSVRMNSLRVLNMTFRSFSFELWIYANSFKAINSGEDDGLIGQMGNTALDKSLHIVIRNHKTYFGFYGDDATGNQVRVSGISIHLQMYIHLL